MQDPDYKVVETSDKHTIKIRTYTTGADEEAINNCITSATTVTIDDNNKSSTVVDATVQQTLNRIKVDRFVVTIDDQEVNKSDSVFALRSADFKDVLDAINAVTKEIDGSVNAKKKPESALPATPSNTTS